MTEIGQMLRDVAWREVKGRWETEAQECPKLVFMHALLAIGGKARCVDVLCKRCRRTLAKVRGGAASLRIETGRWSGLKREERACKQCTAEEVEDEKHSLARCESWSQKREMVAECMKGLVEFPCRVLL